MKDISAAALDHLLAAHPNAKIVERGADRIVRFPMYDINTDRSWFEERRIMPDPESTRMGPLPAFNVRTGNKFNPDGDAKISPLGHLFRIVGYTPPKKDDAD